MFRSEEDARKAAEMVGSDEAVTERKEAEAKQQDEQRHEAAVAQAEQDKAEKQRKEEGSNETETTEEEVKESPNESAAKEEPKPVEEEPENTVEKQQAAERVRETGEPDEAEGEPKLVGKGLFGNIYDQFKGKVKEAVEFLMKHKSGDLLGVFHRSDVGDIDLVWGDDDKGLQHIINGHILVKDPDFKNINEAIFLIDDIVKNGKVVKEGEAKIVFGRMVIGLSYARTLTVNRKIGFSLHMTAQMERASVDLPVETFLPQVGVQASLLFLQKKTDAEMLVPIEDEDYDVFMAIVEQVGKDRRGVPVYEKDDDGAEILFEHYKKWLTYTDNGREIVRQRRERIKHLADDLPKVAKAYKEFKEGLL